MPLRIREEREKVTETRSILPFTPTCRRFDFGFVIISRT